MWWDNHHIPKTFNLKGLTPHKRPRIRPHKRRNRRLIPLLDLEVRRKPRIDMYIHNLVLVATQKPFSLIYVPVVILKALRSTPALEVKQRQRQPVLSILDPEETPNLPKWHLVANNCRTGPIVSWISTVINWTPAKCIQWGGNHLVPTTLNKELLIL